jgi:parallel beta-helix repeat protein
MLDLPWRLKRLDPVVRSIFERPNRQVAALLGWLAFALAMPALTAGAAQLVVNPLRPGNFASIQAAVDAASSGDTIVIQPNGIVPYSEDVVIDGKRDLSIRGSNRVVLQAPVGSPVGTGIFTVTNSRRIQIQGIQIFCDTDPVSKAPVRLGFDLSNSVVDVTLDRSSAASCATGVRVGAPSTHVVISNFGFVDDTVGVQVQAGASGTQILRSASFRGGKGIINAGSGTRVFGFKSQDTTDALVCTGGRNLWVEQGGLNGSGDAGVSLNAGCLGATIRRMDIDCTPVANPPKPPLPPIPTGLHGIQIFGSGVFTLEFNRVTNCSDTGILLMPALASLTYPGGGYVGSNIVTGCAGHGFDVEASFDGWVLDRNVASYNKKSGFFVNSSRNVLIRNTAFMNSDGGFAIGLNVNDRDNINPADNTGIENRSDTLLPVDLQ